MKRHRTTPRFRCPEGSLSAARQWCLLATFFCSVAALLIALTLTDVIASELINDQTVNGDSDGFPRRIENPHLTNLIQVHETVFSGGVPDDQHGFQELKRLGFKTIISVDGMVPDVKTAKKNGLSYIHLPHGYDGISSSRIQEIAKALLVSEGPIYIHCHHGIHRSPAATVAAAVTAGLIPAQTASETLRLAGTNRDLQGLFQSVRTARPVDANELISSPIEFQEISPVPKLARRMVQIQSTIDQLTRLQAENWSSSASMSVWQLRNQSTLLGEHYREMIRTADNDAATLRLRERLKGSLVLTNEFQKNALEFDGTVTQKESLDTSFGKVMQDCRACHRNYRD